MLAVKEFHPIESLTIGGIHSRGIIPQIPRIEIIPHVDEIIVRVDDKEHVVPLGDSERILEELARGNSVEITIAVVPPSLEEALEIRMTWVASKLAGGSKASTLKLVEDITYRLVGVPPFRGLVGSDQTGLMDDVLAFLEFEGEELIIAQICEVSGRKGFEWKAKNWYINARGV